MWSINFSLCKKKWNKTKTYNYSIFFKNSINQPTKNFNVQIANNLNNLFTNLSKKKNFERWVSLYIPAQDATLLPPVGPFLGQHGFNTQNFCNLFNSLTTKFPKGLPLKTNIKLFSDKSILFWIQTPPSSFLLYSLSANKKHISFLDIFKIMIIKKLDLETLSNYSIYSTILGTLKSTSIKFF